MKNLRILRQKRKITQVALAQELNIFQESISSYEKGKTSPSIETLVKLANFLNTSVDYLLGRTDNDAAISEMNIKTMNPITFKILNNCIMLNDKKKEDVLWYTEAIRKKD